MPEGALTSFTVSDAYRYCVGQAQLLRSESRSRREYLIQTDNIKVLDHFFNLTQKSNLTGTIMHPSIYDLTQFFDNLAVNYFSFQSVHL